MCGIFGSFNASKFEVLDKANQQRGNFASGLMYHDKTNFDIQKVEGCFDWDKINLPQGLMYLGHNQAPTSSARKWKEHTSHPFIFKNWVVAHNGVLTNFEELKAKFLPDHENVVDSSIIPALLCKFDSYVDDIKTLSEVLSMLEGTFGLWMVNTKNLNVYLARQGSTLFYDKNSFSSTKGDSFTEMEEGIIYKFNKKGIKKVGDFKSKSPFLEI